MRKSIFFTIVCSLCVLNFGAMAATTRDSANQATRGTTTVRSVAKTNTTTANNTPSVVSRAAVRQQKALNPGTKVAAATENTTIPSECQDAFYGCMDAFCMLDNASGGRCQCSDRITELDQVLEDILKLDDQTYLMATEGVERIQMGEAEEQIIARAKAAGDKVVVEDTAKTKRQSRTLDLSMWNNNIFNMADDDTFDVFDSGDVINTFADKRGDSLYTASAKMCTSQITEACKAYSSMLQLVYAQRIKSDCVGYENSLKAQKIQSQQKLQTAQKALRDAALTEYQNQNKYTTVGDCAIAFTECMQTKAECGTDYTGCVVLAAQENVRNNTAGSRAKQAKIKGAISGADVTLAVSTMNQLVEKKKICESVTKQCVNANKNDAVWELFLRNAAPALKSAELIAEQNLRSSCLPTLAECFKTACKSELGSNDEYDICLSNPEVYKSFCKPQLEPCLEATGGTYDNPTASSLWNGLVALLKSVQVDACTAQVKSCITDVCGKDYSECIGLSVESVGDLCPIDKLTACAQDGKYAYADGTGVNTEAIQEYVAQVAQGLALQIDNALASACQNAANDAMIRVCGDTETCETAQIDLSSLAAMVRPMACRYNNADGTSRTCYPNVAQFGNSDNGCGIYATLVDKPAVSSITYNEEGNFEQDGSSYSQDEFSVASTRQVQNILNGALNRIMNSIESDTKVEYCMKGRNTTNSGFRGFTGVDNSEERTFSNLTSSMRAVVADRLLTSLYTANNELEDRFVDAIDDLNDKIAIRLADPNYGSSCMSSGTGGDGIPVSTVLNVNYEQLCTCDKTPHNAQEEEKNSERANCLTETSKYRWGYNHAGDASDYKYFTNPWLGSRREIVSKEGIYNGVSHICTVRTIKYKCNKSVYWGNSYRCKEYDDGEVMSSYTVDMTKYEPANAQ